VRLDTHVYAGYAVPPFYDSLLAKLIISGNSREEALVRAKNALDTFVIEGVATTIPFLARIVRDPEFMAGDVDTGYVARFQARTDQDAGGDQP
jgi:acetyl-CoA carboxylase biotin carboxylase subunit